MAVSIFILYLEHLKLIQPHHLSIMRFILPAICLISIPFLSAAQQFGGNPPRLKWQQINTDTARIIFPAGMAGQGRRVANMVHYLNRNTRSSIGNREKKVSIVLQNQPMLSNGYVQLGPFRSEFYLAPSPSSYDLGALNWVDQLTLHEYRHVLQNMNFRQGVSKVAGILFGELGQAAITNVAVPNWFWEGDAVVMETALSTQGRGRLPAFFDGFRALTLENKRYNYMKIRNGSYKDFIPDHYPLGYLLSTYGREHHGQTFWKGVTTDAVRYRSVFYPFSRSLKRNTGHNIRGFYNAMIQEYGATWKAYAARPDTTAASLFRGARRSVVNYKYIYPAGPGSWIVSKDGYAHVPGIYLTDSSGREQLLVRPGLGFDDFFSYRNGRIAWAASRYDVRWKWKEYTVIRVYDRHTGKTATVSARGRYFSPDISQDGQQLLAAVSSAEMNYSVQLLQSGTGNVIKSWSHPDNWYYTYPRFTPADDAFISAVRNTQGQMALIRQSFSNSEPEILVPFGDAVMGAPSISGDTVYFTAGYKDVNNVYALTLADKKLYAVTDRGNSALHMAVNPGTGKLLFSEFNVEGYTLYQAPLQPTSWKPAAAKAAHSSWLRPEFHEGGNVLSKVPSDSLQVKKYPQAYRLFNFHSWVPSYDDPEYSLTLISENILNTASTRIGYTYNRNEGSSNIGASFLFGGWFPYISTGIDYTMDRSMLSSSRQRLYWNQLNWHVGLTIPLNLSSGMYSRSLSLGTRFNVEKRYPNGQFKFVVDEPRYFSHSLVFSNQRIKARQNIFTHFGQYLQLQYNQSVGQYYARQFYGRFDLYLPGLARNHSLVLQSALRWKDASSSYGYTDNFVYARGYNTPYYDAIYKLGANYHLPLFYPDWGFAHALYIMRVRANIFYDYSLAHEQRVSKDRRYTSAGTEVFLDTKLWNTLPFSFGVRFSHLFDQDPEDNVRNKVDFIIPIQTLFNY